MPKAVAGKQVDVVTVKALLKPFCWVILDGHSSTDVSCAVNPDMYIHI